MKIDIDVVSPVQRKIRVELPADTVNEEFLRAYQGLGQRVKIKGFRPGKIPRPVLQGLYKSEVRRQVLSRLVERSLNEVIKERGLHVVTRPEVEANNLEEGKRFAFSVMVEVKPEIEVRKYLGQDLEKVKLSVEDTQVENALRRLQDSHAQVEPVEDRDVVEEGDYLNLDFVGSIDGKPLPGAKGENYPLEVGGGKALPEFEKTVVGLKKDGEHTISVTYPKDYFNQELAGKVVVFSVTVRAINRKILPPLDDEFAKDHGECATLDELRRKIRTQFENEFSQIQTEQLKEQLLTRLIDANPFEVPPAMVNQQLHYLLERQQSRFGSQGSAPSTERVSMEQMRKEMEPQARRQVQAMLLLEKIAGLEKISISDREVEARIQEIAGSAGKKGMTLRETYRRDDAREELRSQMLFDRTVEFVLHRARIKEVAPTVDAEGKKD
ncbi:MAG: trigger factor [Candidatus Binatia bacterium]